MPQSAPVKSSWVASVHYENGALTVSTRHGRSFTYIGVPAAVYMALLASPSKGEFINAQIKGKFKESW